MSFPSVASLKVKWLKGEMFFFHPESGLYFDVLRPYPEIANLSIIVYRKGVQVGSGVVWISRRRKPHHPFNISFVGFEDYFAFPTDYFEPYGGNWRECRDRLEFSHLTPYFFAGGDAIEIYDGRNTQHLLNRRQLHHRFIDAVFNDFIANSFLGMDVIEVLWEDFIHKYKPSHAVIAAMLNISRGEKFLSYCLSGGELENGDILQGKKLWDLWWASIGEWRQAVISQKIPNDGVLLSGRQM